MAMREDVRQSTMAIRRLKTRLHDSARRADTASRERSEYREKLQQLEAAHPEWVKHDSRSSTKYSFLIAGIVAVYALDVLLFSPTAEILTEKAFYGFPFITWVARLLVPAGIIMIEILLAAQRLSARQDAEIYYTSNTGYNVWLALGIVFALVLPTLVVGTNLVQASFASESVKAGLRWQLIGLVTLSFVMHCLIIFGGGLHEAKSFLAHKINRNSVSRKIQFHTREFDTESQSFRRDFDNFYDLLHRHRQTFNDNYDPGPWDSITRGFTQRVYGYEVIHAPAAATPTFQNTDIDMTQNSGINHSPDQGNGQSPEETVAVDQRVREEESEVRV